MREVLNKLRSNKVATVVGVLKGNPDTVVFTTKMREERLVAKLRLATELSATKLFFTTLAKKYRDTAPELSIITLRHISYNYLNKSK